MRYILICVFTILLTCNNVFASPATLQSLYESPTLEKRSEAVIFYSSLEPCENCDKTINLLIDILRKNYQKRLHAYLIDTARHPEFVSYFKLKGPLTLVIIRISDGVAFGYRKLTGLQSKINNPTDFSRYITENINNFLGF